ncbi:acyl-CoA N-acyltransferase [Cubamyces sp. BRFM 1775]|nr:acyl-CoA N-acyltransferase [Cubamyces sp. BRFM 1775]
MRSSKAVKRANKASADDLAATVAIPNTFNAKNQTFYVRVKLSSSLTDNEKSHIWDLYEANMRALVEPSSFGWNPSEKREELFHRDARFIMVYLDDPDSQDSKNSHPAPVAFSMFRFELEEGDDVLYCYELQVSELFRNSGLGRFIVDKLLMIGKYWGMDRVILTVLKSNTAARRFYAKQGFEIDPTSPEYESFAEDEETAGADDAAEQEDYDYEILSRALQ